MIALGCEEGLYVKLDWSKLGGKDIYYPEAVHACGDGVFRPLRLQRPGRALLEVPAFLRGFPIAAGTVLPCPATG